MIKKHCRPDESLQPWAIFVPPSPLPATAKHEPKEHSPNALLQPLPPSQKKFIAMRWQEM
jgi:hypothetical protein